VGDHIRKKRLAMKLLQKDVAKRLGVDTCNIFNWEANTRQPQVRFIPAIIRFLGYDPLPAATTWAERLVRRRTLLGLSQTQSAERIGVDASTLARWERGEREPLGTMATRAEQFLREEAIPFKRAG
jgi:transcriptional regulator with XRE-family HTH domain